MKDDKTLQELAKTPNQEIKNILITADDLRFLYLLAQEAIENSERNSGANAYIHKMKIKDITYRIV